MNSTNEPYFMILDSLNELITKHYALCNQCISKKVLPRITDAMTRGRSPREWGGLYGVSRTGCQRARLDRCVSARRCIAIPAQILGACKKAPLFRQFLLSIRSIAPVKNQVNSNYLRWEVGNWRLD